MDKNKNLESKIDQIVKHTRSIDRFNSITWRNLGKSFLLGLFGSFGATVGLAILLSILSLIFRKFAAVPIIGSWFSSSSQYFHK